MAVFAFPLVRATFCLFPASSTLYKKSHVPGLKRTTNNCAGCFVKWQKTPVLQWQNFAVNLWRLKRLKIMLLTVKWTKIQFL